MIKNNNYISTIKQILAKTGWSQSRLANELGVTFAAVNRWLNGHSIPHPTRLREIDRLLKRIVGIAPVPSNELKSVLLRIDAYRKKFKDIIGLLRNEHIQEAFLLELTYNSDAIEGSTLTKKQTEAIIFDQSTIKDKSLVEQLETGIPL